MSTSLYGSESPDIDIFMDNLSDDIELDLELEPLPTCHLPSSSPVDADFELHCASDDDDELIMVDDEVTDGVELKTEEEETEEEDQADDCSDTSESSTQSVQIRAHLYQELTDNRDLPSASSPVIERIEDMVLSFLSQLAFPGKQKDEDDLSERSDPANKAPSRSHYKITIPLVDRRKGQVYG